ncbi:MAG: 50S ribosomal protein L10 [Magnetococcales bacterium]|nr:50S ribosomal protein L10 [Magnetococcales bacterium]
MKKEKKVEVIEDVRKGFEEAGIVIATHYRGLKVSQITQLRRKIRDAGGEFKVIKNTLAHRASRGTQFEALTELLTGPTGIIFSKDPATPAKALMEFTKTNPQLVVRGGVLGGKLLDASGIEQLSKLPSREVLLGQMLSVFNGPIRGFVTVLHAVPSGFVRALDQIRQSKEEAAA